MLDFTELKRYPHRKNELLQAWDSADELLIAHLLQHVQGKSPDASELKSKRILILNDAFGALSFGLGIGLGVESSQFSVTTYTDSFVSAKGIELNTNGAVSPIHELSALSGVYDFVCIKVPKNLSFFEDELYRISGHLHPDSLVVSGAMIKHLPKGAFDLLEKVIGKTHTSLAKKKARLIFAKFQKQVAATPYPLSVRLDSFATPFVNHSNLFSREKLDVGTRFFLEHIPVGNFSRILDLGCANGVIGIRAQQKNPEAHLIFTDESDMAIQSARANWQNYYPSRGADFVWTHAYENAEASSVDLVLCNPPFHQQMVVGDFIATQMFSDSKHALKPGGLLRVIGNSHLSYGAELKKLFGNCQKIAANSKFVIWDAVNISAK
jgi:23S rRNA (guanine1835-N2)-methyltransferase